MTEAEMKEMAKWADEKVRQEENREKLIKLLKDSPSLDAMDDVGYEMGADHLIANGVAVQEWIPATERLPENNTRVVVCYNNPIDGEKTVSSDVFWRGHWVRFGETVTHWMPLPEPPKGE